MKFLKGYLDTNVPHKHDEIWGNDERASNPRYSSLGNTDALRRLLRTAK
jgi:hypothetical protein